MNLISIPDEWYDLLQEKENVVLLETSQQDQEKSSSFLFFDPVHILEIHQPSELSDMLTSIQEYVQQGYYVAGYFAYECGYGIEKLGLADYRSEKQPLAWFGVYRQPLVFKHKGSAQAGLYHPCAARSEATYHVSNLHFNLDASAYREKIERVKEYICAGDVYQINFTGRYTFTFSGSPVSFYRALKNQQKVRYGGYVRAAGQDILCFSPELFFRIEGQKIKAKPMKGTAPRGRTLAEDQQQAAWLHNDIKNRAENVMIVDLLRNDLGHICQIGSVTVPHLFVIEEYATLFQMASTVEGLLKDENDYHQLFESLFPCGSITGAPKIRAMEIIKELEDSPRGVYTGSIGYFSPGSDDTAGEAVFNVAIRTIVLENGQGEMGIGSGVTYSSRSDDEYAECAVKARFLTAGTPKFALLETIRWEQEYCFLDEHLQRLAESARYFGYPYDRNHIDEALARLTDCLAAGEIYKVRLKLAGTGEIECEAIQLSPEASPTVPQTVVLSTECTDSCNRMYYHKTTDRNLYDRATRFAQENGYADVIFLNEKGEVTEGAISNIFLEKAGNLLTPPVSCGLLNGIYRQHMLKSNPEIQEKILYRTDLLEAEKIYICNAVRGLRQVRLNSLEQGF